MCAGIHSQPAVDDLTELWGKFFVGAVARRPERVAADSWHGVIVEVRDPGGLEFVNEIRVPAGGAAGVAEGGGTLAFEKGGPDDLHGSVG